jgi:peroxiredoxin
MSDRQTGGAISGKGVEATDARAAMAEARTQHGASLLSLSEDGPLVVAFLRHLGCPFCREVLGEVRDRRARLDAAGVRVAFVHMGTEEEARALFERFGLADAHRVSDPDQRVYRAFEVRRGGPLAIGGPYVLWRLLFLAVKGVLPGRVAGDVWQLPGAFLVRDGEIEASRRARTQADRMDVCGLAEA